MATRIAATRHATSRGTAPRRAPLRAIRWDRVGRLALLTLLAGVLFLYVGPAVSWVSTYKESKTRSAEVVKLRRENRVLKARRDELGRPATLEREARELGMVRRGERPYVVTGLPRGR